jgi:hypothetical protein
LSACGHIACTLGSILIAGARLMADKLEAQASPWRSATSTIR